MTDSTRTPDSPDASGDANDSATGMDFLPPPYGEHAIPQPPPGGGATDRGLGGELVTDTDEIDAAMSAFAATVADIITAAAIPGAPTWEQVYRLAKSQLATWAAGRRRENVNDYTIWYYGTSAVSAAFCFIFICWCLCHAISKRPTAAQQQAALSLLGGQKLAYVPYIRDVPGYRSGASGLRVGAIVAVGGFAHIGFCVRVGGGTFDLLSGNSVSGDSDDAITIKRYSLGAVSGHVNLPYPKTATTGDDDMPIRTSLSIARGQALEWGKFTPLNWGKENVDPKDTHSGENPGYLPPVDSWADFTALVRIEGLSAGDEYQLRFEVHDWAQGKSAGDPWTEIHGDAVSTSGTQFASASCSKKLEKGQHVYVSVMPIPGGGDAKGRPAPKAISGRWTIRQDQG